MTPQEKAIEYINVFRKFTNTINDAFECALIIARELRNQYEVEHDLASYNFWNNVIIELKMMQP